MKNQSYFVQCQNLTIVSEVLDRCFAQGFKAVASQNLNGAGWIVEFWK